MRPISSSSLSAVLRFATAPALAAVVAPLALAGCISSTHAMQSFSADQSCPQNASTFQRTAVVGADLAPAASAPADIAADAERLAVWQRNHDPARFVASYDQLTAFKVTGCGIATDYLCWNESVGDETPATCEAIDLGRNGQTFDGYVLQPSLRERLEASPKRSGLSRFLGF
jgi:hypothetical protein